VARPTVIDRLRATRGPERAFRTRSCGSPWRARARGTCHDSPNRPENYRVNSTGPSEALIEALTSLWRIPAPGPEKLSSTAAFKWLSKTALLDYPNGHDGGRTSTFDFALEGALRVLGLPCQLPPSRNSPDVPPAEAARLLDQAFRATRCRRRHLVPLDLSGELPELTFGPVRLGKFSEPELQELLNATRLDRRFPHLPPVATKLFSWFRWSRLWAN
jgi:hypothetical protein